MLNSKASVGEGDYLCLPPFHHKAPALLSPGCSKRKEKKRCPIAAELQEKKSLIYKSVLWLRDQSRIRSGCLWIRKSGLIEKHKREPEFAITLQKFFSSMVSVWESSEEPSSWSICKQQGKTPGHHMAPYDTSRHLTSPHSVWHRLTASHGLIQHFREPHDIS